MSCYFLSCVFVSQILDPQFHVLRLLRSVIFSQPHHTHAHTRTPLQHAVVKNIHYYQHYTGDLHASRTQNRPAS